MKPCLLSMIGGMLAVLAGVLGIAGVIDAQLALSLGGLGGMLAVTAAFLPKPACKHSCENAKPVAVPEAAKPVVPVQPALPPAPAPAAREEEALMLMTLLQEKGRFVDFLMDDIAAYNDAQVGAAARIIHQGCKTVVVEAFKPVAVAGSAENAPISLPQDVSREQYKLVGTVTAGTEIRGRLLHKGWKPTQVKLPKRTRPLGPDELPVITPAEVQL
ncbi:MAG: DUF2760 domain-containing protein [Verrucomicrobiota bacterium]|nr:DUF2760 domain-containing protein [Verrucomicrobiota bacterium]